MMSLTATKAVGVFALLGYLVLLLPVLRAARRRPNRSFALFFVATLIWQAGVTGVSFSTDPAVALGFYRVTVALGVALSLAFAQFASDFLGISTRSWIIPSGYLLFGIMASWVLLGGPDVITSVVRSPVSGLWLPEFGPLAYGFVLFSYICIAYGASLLLAQHRRTASALERNRIRYLLIGLLLLVAGSLAKLSPTLRPYPVDMIMNAFFAFSIAYAILRYQLLDISVVVRKGLLYSILTVVTGVIYFVPIFLALNLLNFVIGYQVFLLSLVLAGLTALLVEPLRDKVQSEIDRLFFREKYDSTLMLQRLSRTAASVLDLGRLAEIILDDITQTMHIAKGAIFIKQEEGDRYHLRAYKGSDPPPRELSLFRTDSPVIRWLSHNQTSLSSRVLDTDPSFIGLWAQEREDVKRIRAELFVPLLVRRKLIGILMLGPKLSEAAFSAEEQQILDTLANQMAVAIENASLFSATVAEQERTSAILDQAFAGIILLDTNLRITSLNPAAEAIIGLRAAQIKGKPLSDILGPGITGGGSSLHQAMTTGQRVTPREETLVCGDRTCDVLLGVAPLGDGFLLSLADITQIKEADRFKSDIVANVSHEFRTPLAIIKAYSELLMDGENAGDASLRREFLRVIDSETDRLAGLVSDLLDLARLEARRGVEEMAPVVMAEIVDEVVAEARFQADACDVSIDAEVAAVLPAVMGNKPLLITMLHNLLGNAIQFSHPGGRVQVTAERAGSSPLLEVTDHGIGITEIELPHLFERFYRSTTAQEAGIRGTGIGLVLVKQAVEAHHGSITVDSHIGCGACFAVTLPTTGAAPEAAIDIIGGSPEPGFSPQ